MIKIAYVNKNIHPNDVPWIDFYIAKNTKVFVVDDIYGICTPFGQAVSFTEFGPYIEIPFTYLSYSFLEPVVN